MMAFMGFRTDELKKHQAYKEGATLLDPPQPLHRSPECPWKPPTQRRQATAGGESGTHRRDGGRQALTAALGANVPAEGHGPAVTAQDARIGPRGHRRGTGAASPRAESRRPAPFGSLSPQAFNFGCMMESYEELQKCLGPYTDSRKMVWMNRFYGL